MLRAERTSGVALGGAALAATVLLALAGCASTPGGSPTASSAPPSATTAGDRVVGAAWLADGHGLALVSLGSSSCVPQSGEVTARGQTVTVRVPALPADTACTSDLGPRATFVALPGGVDPSKDVELVATGALTGSATLAGIEAMSGSTEEHAASAGWFEGAHASPGVPDGGFVFLTYGSSSCPPTVKSVAATGDAAVTVTLEAPTSAPCTMDIVPRAGLAVVPDSVTATDVTVTFAGAVTGSAKILGAR